MSKYLTITGKNGLWFVEWQGIGSVVANNHKWALLDIAFKEVKCFQFGIGKNVTRYRSKQYNNPYPKSKGDMEEYTEWFVHWISLDAWMFMSEEDTPKFSENLFREHKNMEVTGVVFHTLDDAEAFVYAVEKRMTVHLLKAEYV
jgi:hypothetical protein